MESGGSDRAPYPEADRQSCDVVNHPRGSSGHANVFCSNTGYALPLHAIDARRKLRRGTRLASVGVRSGVGETGNGFEMKQYELYSLYRLPWGYRFSSASALTTRLDSTIGGLEHQAQTGFIATSSPTLALGLAHDKISLNGGVGGAVLSEQQFEKIDFGGNFQFRQIGRAHV